MELELQGEQRKTINISGMGETYEETCQRMLYLGLQHLDQLSPAADENAFQVLQKTLEKAWENDPEIERYGISGAMQAAVMNHLAYIHVHSYKKWIADVAEDSPNRICLVTDPPHITTPPFASAAEAFAAGQRLAERSGK